jgi:hypothetical protein
MSLTREIDEAATVKWCEISHATSFSCHDILDSQVVGEYSIRSYRKPKILKPDNDATRKVLK